MPEFWLAAMKTHEVLAAEVYMQGAYTHMIFLPVGLIIV